MKKLFFITSITLFFLLFALMFILSTIGFETDRFNKFIIDQAIENKKNISLKLEKIKFKLDIKDFNLFLETKNPELIYKDLIIPIENVKVYLDFYSLIKSKGIYMVQSFYFSWIGRRVYSFDLCSFNYFEIFLKLQVKT